MCPAHGGHKIRVRPQCRQFGCQVLVLFAKVVGRDSLDMLNRLVDSELGIYFQQQMHMVWHDLHFDYIDLNFRSRLQHQLLQTAFHFSNKDFASILWTPDNVVFAGVDYVGIGFVFHFCIIQQRAIYVNTPVALYPHA